LGVWGFLCDTDKQAHSKQKHVPAVASSTVYARPTPHNTRACKIKRVGIQSKQSLGWLARYVALPNDEESCPDE
jgi:hypothetical protein